VTKQYTNEQIIQKATNSPTKTVSFDGGIYSVGSDVVNGQVSDVVIKGRTYTQIFEIDQNNFGNSFNVYGTTTANFDKIIFNNAGWSNRIGIKNFSPIQENVKYGMLLKKDEGSIDLFLNGLSPNNAYVGRAVTGQYVKVIIDDISADWNGHIYGGTAASKRYPFEIYDFRLIPLISTEMENDFNTLTAEELFNKYTYVYGTKSTNSVRIRSVNEDETKESIVYVNLPQGEELRSLPNGVKDEVNVTTGVKTQRVQNKVLQAKDIFNMVAEANFDRIFINTPADCIPTSYKSDGRVQLIGYTEYTGAPELYNDVININKFMFSSYLSPTRIALFVAKGTYADLAAAKDALTGTTLIYQLAEPVVTKLPAQAPLQVFENGTVYVEPMGDPSETTLPSVELTVPIAGGNKVGIATHNYAGAAADWTLTNSESKCFMLAVSNAGGAANIIAPNRPGTMYAISNASGYAITIKKSGGNGVAVTNAKTVLVIHNGTDYTALTAEL
jgi:hypothetical protein